MQYIRDAPDADLQSGEVTRIPWHTRRKAWWERAWRGVRKTGCCAFTCCCNCHLWTCTCGAWGLYCVPLLAYPYCRGWGTIIALVIAAFCECCTPMYFGASPSLFECGLHLRPLPPFLRSSPFTFQGLYSCVFHLHLLLPQSGTSHGTVNHPTTC